MIMNQSAVQQQNKLQKTIEEIKRIFKEQPSKCLWIVKAQMQANKESSENLTLSEIRAACQSLSGNYQRAQESWQKCLELALDNPAYLNNLAWVCIKRKQYVEAATYLNNIKRIWHHPSIYWNLALVYQCGGVQDYSLITDAMQKKQAYQANYPQYQQDKGLIFLFLLNQRQRYSQSIKQFKSQTIYIKQYTQDLIQRPLLSKERLDKLTQLLQAIQQKIQNRKYQQKQYGIVLQKQIKAYIQAMQMFQHILLRNYDLNWRDRLNEYLIEGLNAINSNVFNVVLDQQSDYMTIQQSILAPLKRQLTQIATKMTDFITNLNKNQLIRDQQMRRTDRYDRPEIKLTQLDYQFKSKMDDMTMIIKDQELSQLLRIQKNQQYNPLLVYTSLRRLNYTINQVYVNHNMIRTSQYQITAELSSQLQTLPIQHKILIQKYYYSLNLLLTFYNYYGTNNFYYQYNGKQTQIKLNRFINIVTPVFNQVGNADSGKNVGWICNQIHFGVEKYLYETDKIENQQKSIKRLLKNVHTIVKNAAKEDQSLVNGLFLDLLTSSKKEYLEKLLNKQLIETDGKGNTKAHQYYLWKMNQHHLLNKDRNYRELFVDDDKWIITNVQLLLINLLSADEDKVYSLMDLFLNCHYQSRQREPEKKKIIKKYYEANHTITKLEKVASAVKKVLKVLLP